MRNYETSREMITSDVPHDSIRRLCVVTEGLHGWAALHMPAAEEYKPRGRF